MTQVKDPILIKRAKITTIVSRSLKIGYGLYGLSIIILFISLITRFTTTASYSIIFCLIIGSLFLAPAMVFKYALKAANKADKEQSW